MKITIRVPDKVGVYKLNRKARKKVAMDLIGRNLRLFEKMREDVSEITLVVDGKSFIVNHAEVDSIIKRMIITRRKYKNINNNLYVGVLRRANQND